MHFHRDVLAEICIPVQNDLIRNVFQYRTFGHGEVHILHDVLIGRAVHLGRGLICDQHRRILVDVQVNPVGVAADVSAARVHDDVVNLPGIIQIMRADHFQGPRVILPCCY